MELIPTDGIPLELGPVRAEVSVNPDTLLQTIEREEYFPTGPTQILPPLKPLIEPISFSATEIDGWYRCRRAWALSSFNEYALTKLVPKVPLEFGSIWHKAHEDWVHEFYNPQPHETHNFEHHFLLAADKELRRIRRVYKEEKGEAIQEYELEPITDELALGRVMAQNYQFVHKTPLPDTIRLVQVEQKILTPLPGTFHCACVLKSQAAPPTSPTPYLCNCPSCWTGHDTICSVVPPSSCCKACGDYMYLETKLDGIAQGRHTNRFFVLERKTFGARPRKDHLQMNSQFLKYVYALERMAPGECGGLFYDGAWKHDGYDHRFKPPKQTYKTEDLFLRDTFQRTPSELAECEIFLTGTFLAMADPKQVLTINRPWQGCWDCDFEKLCTQISRGEDYSAQLADEYTVRVPD